MIAALDHVVLTTRDEPACLRFYVEILGMRLETFGEGRRAFAFGGQKINLHVAGAELEPHAHLPLPGAQDWCLLADRPLDEVVVRLAGHGVEVELGPVARTGARGPITSVYVRDPDRNLIEIATYDAADPAATATDG